jgi:exodeoxyribonuclease VII large subunit
VIRDILHRLADRFPTRVLVWPVLVQGQGAAEQVTQALQGFGSIVAGGAVPRPDLLIVARGGGSIEDLWAFNEEIVVRAIAASPIPVISAVGHETDTTLADHAADRRAPTPTAAAEMAVPVLRELSTTLDELALRQRKCALRPVTLGRERLATQTRLLPRPEALAERASQRLDELAERLRRGLSDRAAMARGQLLADSARLSAPLLRAGVQRALDRLEAVRLAPNLLSRAFAERHQRLEALERLRRQLDPKAPLARGYALVCAPAHPVIASREVAARQERLTLEFADGTLEVSPGAHRRPSRPAPGSPSGAQPKLL